MGVDQTHISRYHKNADGSLSIYGDHFTNWSRIYVNDEKMSTVFVSDEHVMLPSEYAADLENGDILKVCQVGSSNTIFSMSLPLLLLPKPLNEVFQPAQGRL